MDLLKGKWKFVNTSSISEEFQKRLFEAGGRWLHFSDEISYVSKSFFYVSDGILTCSNSARFYKKRNSYAEITILQAIDCLKETLSEKEKKKPFPPEWIGHGKEVMIIDGGRWKTDTLDFLAKTGFYLRANKYKEGITPTDLALIGKEVCPDDPEIITIERLIENYDLSRLPGRFFNETRGEF